MDFDGDRRPDLLSGSNCCDRRGFIFFRRKDDGSWEPRRRLTTTIPNGASAALDMGRSFVTAADWNGDGVPDLLWLEDNGVLVAAGPFEGDGPIPLAHRLDFAPRIATDGAYLEDFTVADWDRDGKPDLLVRTSVRRDGGQIIWYRNLGGPGLTRLREGKPLVELPADQSADGFCVCDWNADGRPDLMVTRFERLAGGQQYRESVWLYPRE